MPLLYLLALIAMMFVGGMLIKLNPEPVTFRVALGGNYTVQSSILEVIGYSAIIGAAVMAIPYLRTVWTGYRERTRLERESGELRGQNVTLRRKAEDAESAARLLEAAVAEAEERYARLEARARPLLTHNPELDPDDPPTDGQPRRPRRTQRAASRWQRGQRR